MGKGADVNNEIESLAKVIICRSLCGKFFPDFLSSTGNLKGSSQKKPIINPYSNGRGYMTIQMINQNFPRKCTDFFLRFEGGRFVVLPGIAYLVYPLYAS